MSFLLICRKGKPLTEQLGADDINPFSALDQQAFTYKQLPSPQRHLPASNGYGPPPQQRHVLVSNGRTQRVEQRQGRAGAGRRAVATGPDRQRVDAADDALSGSEAVLSEDSSEDELEESRVLEDVFFIQ